MREITGHITGIDSLTDSLKIESDLPDEKAGNGTHRYDIRLADGSAVGTVQFQHGPRGEPGSVPGCTSQALVEVLIDHFESFQTGPFRCRENALVITALEQARDVMRRRVIDRSRRGVLGKNLA